MAVLLPFFFKCVDCVALWLFGCCTLVGVIAVLVCFASQPDKTVVQSVVIFVCLLEFDRSFVRSVYYSMLPYLEKVHIDDFVLF